MILTFNFCSSKIVGHFLFLYLNRQQVKANHAAKLKDDAVGEDEGAHGGVLPLEHADN